jgi:flagellar protein FliO/FliZ
VTNDYALYLRVVLSLALVLGLIGTFAFIAKKYGGRRLGPRGQRRLAVVEVAPIDQRRRLVLVRRDGIEHLILIGGPHDLLIENAIAPPGPEATTTPSAQGGKPYFSRQLDEVRF